MKVIHVFKKQGGLKLIKNYVRNRVLFTAVVSFLLLGKSRTALEILRLSVQLKIKHRLAKKYLAELINFDQNYTESEEKMGDTKNSNIIWICWFQGMENAPQLVKSCYNSLKENLSTKKIIVITTENMDEYINFPEYIITKWQEGAITNTHMTDLLRLELLSKYGGTWIDSTVLCTQKEANIPDYFFDSELFFFQSLKPGRDGKATYLSSWYITAKPHNKIIDATKYLCYIYWKENNKLDDYFLLHDFMSMVLDFYKEDWDKIIPRDNATPHELLLRIFEKYDNNMWQAITTQTPFHKLSYKFTDEDTMKKGTNYEKIVAQYTKDN